jgi:hypothetical protein
MRNVSFSDVFVLAYPHLWLVDVRSWLGYVKFGVQLLSSYLNVLFRPQVVSTQMFCCSLNHIDKILAKTLT